MNWAMDWAWWAKDERQKQLSDRLQAFFESEGITDYACQYTLEGRQISKYEDPPEGLVAMNAVAALAAAHRRAEKFIEALWNTKAPTGEYRYYNGMLYFLGMLHCAGMFRIWGPK